MSLDVANANIHLPQMTILPNYQIKLYIQCCQTWGWEVGDIDLNFLINTLDTRPELLKCPYCGKQFTLDDYVTKLPN